MAEKVVIVGASDKPDRFAYKAMVMLKQYGHEPILVNPTLKEIEGHTVYPDLDQVLRPVDTLTMYVNPRISVAMKDQIIALKPKRVIFNPGTENPAIAFDLKKTGIDTIHACTLVMLSTGEF
ncbi:CoA-binding protein [Pseudobdellovibrio sp. HCB154]|uniref:CoA-binding protein n=1 Tax=Pseudobdellovibrio sp. HCB154 TaxID=3386277 RepID=UPI00391736DC